MTHSGDDQLWVDEYRQAMLGTDSHQIEIAKSAIAARIASFLDVSGSEREMEALKQAYEDLLLLERESGHKSGEIP